MSFAKIYTRGVFGLDAPSIEVEVHISQGLPSLTIVGLAEAAVRESKDRVRSAIINSSFTFPTKRLTINLAPADLPKEGARLDLPIALGILIASGQISSIPSENYEFIGELSLDGQLRAVSSTLTIAMACEQQKRALFLPCHNADEANQLTHLEVYPAQSLKEVCNHFLNTDKLQKLTKKKSILFQQEDTLDLIDIKGQKRPRRALEIAAAGGHSLLFRGPPGTGVKN
ncbi:ATP-binding protein [Acinetobacter nectaris]|nr:ATP-binding protein [Acinetobacter nectaris]